MSIKTPTTPPPRGPPSSPSPWRARRLSATVTALREATLDAADVSDENPSDMALDWLGYRRTRWPDSASPHLLINQHSAMGTGPVSTIYFARTKLRGQAATLERLRVDRQLEEALARGPDPLHLASMFGLDPKTAIRYAENARQLLITAAGEQDPAASGEPKDPVSP